MFYTVLSLHIVLSVVLVFLVLMQQGKGADMGAAFGGGGSNTLFGAGGATSMMVKFTTAVAILFMCTSISLIRLYGSADGAIAGPVNPLAGSVMEGLPAPAKNQQAAPSEAVPAPQPEQATAPKVDEPKQKQ